MLGWIVILAVLATWELFARVARRPHFPTFAKVIGAFLHTRPGRVGLFVLWVWIGFHFFGPHLKTLLTLH
jgi:hypothetical protein